MQKESYQKKSLKYLLEDVLCNTSLLLILWVLAGEINFVHL